MAKAGHTRTSRMDPNDLGRAHFAAVGTNLRVGAGNRGKWRRLIGIETNSHLISLRFGRLKALLCITIQATAAAQRQRETSTMRIEASVSDQ
ncbi:hypothetical protein NL676_005289 [Syzygium grande]|nr:hypothetical protein NL676_005289 [Syzygium grande]